MVADELDFVAGLFGNFLKILKIEDSGELRKSPILCMPSYNQHISTYTQTDRQTDTDRQTHTHTPTPNVIGTR